MTTLLQTTENHKDRCAQLVAHIVRCVQHTDRSFPKRSFTFRSSPLLRLGPATLLEDDEATGRDPLPNLYRSMSMGRWNCWSIQHA